MHPWIEHVKKFASKKGISYSEALKDPKVKDGYKSASKKGGTVGDDPEPPPPAPTRREKGPKTYDPNMFKYASFIPPRDPKPLPQFYEKGPKTFDPFLLQFGLSKPTKNTDNAPFPTVSSTGGRRIVRGKPPPPPPPPSIQMSSIKELEKFLDDKKDSIQQVLREKYSKKQFVQAFHPDRCFDSNKAIDKLMMKVVGKTIVLNEPFTRQCEAIFKKFSSMY